MMADSFQKRILVIADSLALPDRGIRYEMTYPHLLKKSNRDVEFVINAGAEATTESLRIDENDRLSPIHYDPDVIVTCLGIVDCAPRFSHPLERRLVFDVAPDRVSSLYAAGIKRLRVPKPRWRYVNPATFERNLVRFYAFANERDVDVLSIPIRPSTDALEAKSPHAAESIELYNDIYRRLTADHPVTLVDPFGKLDRDEIGSGDGIHLSSTAHRAIADAISANL